MQPRPPSGQQYQIERGDQSATVTEVGAGLRTCTAGDWAVLDGYAEDEMCSAGRGAALLPWPNRIEDGRYEFRGQSYQLALTEPERLHAIHGLTRWANWQALEVETGRVVMGVPQRERSAGGRAG